MTFGLLESIMIDEIARPSKAGPLYAGAARKPPVPKIALQLTPVPAGTSVCAARCVHVSPPFVVL